MNSRQLAFIVLTTSLATSSVLAAPPVGASGGAIRGSNAAGLDFYEKKIRPALNQYCYKCHSQTADKLKGSLYLDSREAMLKGGETGPAITPSHPEKSLLIEAIRYTNADMQMPPKGRLPESVVADLTRWVQMGAPAPIDPNAAKNAIATAPSAPGTLHNIKGIEYAKLRQEHWAWQPIHAPQSPAVKNTTWASTDIDRFILAGHEAKGVHPVGDADRTTLIRRVSFDLVGLPPTPAEVQAFVTDSTPDAFAKVVDRLLASPAFGERWGRHWLDVARYAESTGSSRNVPYEYAWRYRNYVIDSFNQDKPYNQFVTEQLAGDLMPAANSGQRDQQMIATGFLALGIKDLNEKDHLKYTMDNVDEQIDVVSRSMLGLTVGCARCHDHKFDPIPTAEYYSLAGIFKSTEILAGVKGKKGGMGKVYDAPQLLAHVNGGTYSPPSRPASAQAPVPPVAVQSSAVPVQFGESGARAQSPPPAASVSSHPQGLAALNAQLEKAQDDLRNLRTAFSNGSASHDQLAAKRSEVLLLLSQIQAAESGTAQPLTPAPRRIETAASAHVDAPANVSAMSMRVVSNPTRTVASPQSVLNIPSGPAVAVRDQDSPADAQICVHGETENLGPTVPRGFISLVPLEYSGKVTSSHSGRLELAQWITNPANPLPARVMANRIWQHLFGEGIVRTVDNFGTTGETPSNQELLDYLASRFETGGSSGFAWSVKSLIREVVLSHSYQLASTYDAADASVDPSNRLVWRVAPHRLEAEAMRDAMLVSSGQLDISRPSGSPVQSIPVAELRKTGLDAAPEETVAKHRSVYLPILREMVPPVLQLFDFAEPEMVTGDRQVTTVPTQALFMMNDAFVIEQSRQLAGRLMSNSTLDDNGRADLAYRLVLVRPPTAAERARAVQYVASYARDDMSSLSRKSAGPKADAWASLCQALFCSAEFRYVN